jgi:molybdopterin-binding protein
MTALFELRPGDSGGLSWVNTVSSSPATNARHVGPQLETTHMEISARNQLVGRVVSTKLGNIMAEVVVEVDPATVVAAITRSSVEALGIKQGDSVRVIIKATEVMIAK